MKRIEKFKICFFLLTLLLSNKDISFSYIKRTNFSNDNLKNAESNRLYIENESRKDSLFNPVPFYQLSILGGIRFYQKFVSPSKGSYCPMHPSCSLYGYQSFKKYNIIKALTKTADRLHRCGHDLDNYIPIEVEGYVRFYDPLELSDNHEFYMKNILNKTEIYFSPQSISQTELNDITYIKNINDSDKYMFQFAKNLENSGYYDQAIIEYKRLIFYYPESDLADDVNMSIFRCYYKNRLYLDGIHWGQGLINKKISKHKPELKFYIGASYFKLGNTSLSRNYFSEIIEENKGIYRDKSLILKGLSFAYDDLWEEAYNVFSNVNTDSELYKNAEQFKKLSLEGKSLKKKNPTTAGILAIIPGLGYLYDGYKQTAFASFLVNGLFIWGTVSAFEKNNESLGTMFTILSLGWYTGNIYGSVISAQRKNMKLKYDLISKFNIGFNF